MLDQDTRILNALERAGIYLAYSALALALLTLVAWAGHVGAILFPVAGATALKPLPAFCVALIAAALLVRVHSGKTRYQLLATVMAAAGALFPVISALQHLTGADYGVGRLLFPDATELEPVAFPGRLALGMLGLAVITLEMHIRRVRVADVLAIGSAVIGFVSLAGYTYQADAVGTIPRFFNVIAPAAALSFVLLAGAVLIARPSLGLARLLAARSFGGIVLRRLVPVTLLFPLALGMLRTAGQQSQWWDPAYGSALNTGLSTLLFTALVWWAAVQLHQLDAQREAQSTALRQSEERYRNILETANEGIWILDLGARTSYVNKRLQEMLGYTAAEMAGRPLYDFVAGGQTSDAEEHFSSRVDGKVESYDFQFLRKDGTTLWAIVNSTPLKDSQGRFDGVLKMISDITARKEAEEELRLSEEALQRAQQVAHIGSWEWDVASDRITWSDELYRIYGVEPAEFEASFEAFNARLHPDDREFVQQTIGLAFEHCTGFHFEHRILRPNGEVRYIDARGECSAGAGGRTVLLRGTGQDITERKHAELALREAQEHFESVLKNAGMSIAVKDLRGRYVIANAEAAEALGITAAAELIGKRDEELVPADVAARIRATDQETMQSEDSLSIEQELPGADQPRHFWTTKFPMRDAHGTVIGLGVISQEITELRRAERALRESESRNRSILEAALDAVVSIDAQSKITSWNRQAEALFGWKEQEAVGRSISIIIPDRYRAAHNEGMARFRASGEAPVVGKVLQVEARHRDGREFPVDLAIGQASATAGEVSFSAFIRDISERRRAEKEARDKSLQLEQLNTEMQVALQELANSHQLLQDQAAALERSNADLDDFAYIASHDLKEPLRGISNYAHFLHEDYGGKLDEAGSEMLATLPRLTKRLETLLDALLKYSRLNRAEVVPLPTDLDTVVDEVKEMLEARIREGNVEIRVPRPLPTIMCDRSQTTEIFLNLISNAIKYNDEPLKLVEIGYVVESELDPEMKSDNRANGANGAGDQPSQRELVFYVSDNGIGIPEKFQETVFGAFRRLHSRDKYGGGTGVGLAIVKKMVERQGGRIWVESEAGQGSTFYFTLNPEVLPPGGVSESRA